MQLEGLPEGAVTQGMPDDLVYTVTEIYPSHVVLDGNHPLAGLALRLRLKVMDVREATEEEVARGDLDRLRRDAEHQCRRGLADRLWKADARSA